MKTHEELMQMKAEAQTASEESFVATEQLCAANLAYQKADQKASQAYKAYQDAVGEIYFK